MTKEIVLSIVKQDFIKMTLIKNACHVTQKNVLNALQNQINAQHVLQTKR